MKTKRRHELQTNWLADHIGVWAKRIEPYSKAITGVIVCAALIVVAYLYLNRQSTAERAAGWDAYYDAIGAVNRGIPGAVENLEDMASQFKDTAPGHWARVRLAEIQFNNGVEALFRDRPEGNDLIRSAAENYEAVLANARPELLRQQATMGLARARESLGELDEARRLYGQLLERWPDSAFAIDAERRIADLERSPTKRFYDWFARQDPRPQMESGTFPGTPFGDPGSLLDQPPSRLLDFDDMDDSASGNGESSALDDATGPSSAAADAASSSADRATETPESSTAEVQP